MLEMLVHLNARELLESYRVFEIEVADADLLRLDSADLPDNWRTDPAPPELQDRLHCSILLTRNSLVRMIAETTPMQPANPDPATARATRLFLFLPPKLALADIAYDVPLETGIRIQPLPVWEGEWTHAQRYPNPRLLENIRHEGIPL